MFVYCRKGGLLLWWIWVQQRYYSHFGLSSSGESIVITKYTRSLDNFLEVGGTKDLVCKVFAYHAHFCIPHPHFGDSCMWLIIVCQKIWGGPLWHTQSDPQSCTWIHFPLNFQTNQFLERHKPWLLAKHPLDHSWLQTVLAVAIESLRLSSCLLSPIIPHSSTEILARLGFSQNLNSPDTLECLLSGEESVKRLERRIKLKLGGEPVFRKL